MDSIIDFFSGIWDGLCGVFDFIAWLVESIAEAVGMSIEALTSVTFYTTYLPATLAACCIACVTIALIFKVKG